MRNNSGLTSLAGMLVIEPKWLTQLEKTKFSYHSSEEKIAVLIKVGSTELELEC